MPLDGAAQDDAVNATTGSPIAGQISAARDAGYKDEEIRGYLQQSKTWAPKFDAAAKAGYSQEDVWNHLGLPLPKAAAPPPTPMVSDSAIPRGDVPQNDAQLQDSPGKRILQAGIEGAKQGWGDQPLGLGEKGEEGMRKMGIFGEGPLRQINEAVVKPAWKAGDAAWRAMQSGFAGAQGAVNQFGEEIGHPGLGPGVGAFMEAFPQESMGMRGVLEKAPHLAPAERRAINEGKAIARGAVPPVEPTPQGPPPALTDIPPPTATAFVRPEDAALAELEPEGQSAAQPSRDQTPAEPVTAPASVAPVRPGFGEAPPPGVPTPSAEPLPPATFGQPPPSPPGQAPRPAEPITQNPAPETPITPGGIEGKPAEAQLSPNPATAGVPESGAPPALDIPSLVEAHGQDGAMARVVANSLADTTKPPMTARDMQAAADQVYGGKLSEGAYGRDRLYDSIELGVNRFIASDPKRFDVTADAPRATEIANELAQVKDRLPTQTVRAGEKDTHQQFSTPPDYAYAANWVAKLEPKDTVLEPSAGTGSLAVHAMNGAHTVITNELSDKRAAMLADLHPTAIMREDATHIHNTIPDDVKPSVVVMNPPFSAAPGRMANKTVLQTGANHVMAGLASLQDGGRLVAIVGRGMTMEAPAFKDWWKNVAAKFDVRANIGVGGAIYRKYGTNFGTRLLVIDKVPPSGRDIVGGEVGTASDLIGKLSGVRDERPGSPIEQVDRQPTGAPVATQGEGAAGPRPELPGTTGVLGAGERVEAGGSGEPVAPKQPEPVGARPAEQPAEQPAQSDKPGGSSAVGAGDGIRSDGSGKRDEPGITPAPETVVRTEAAGATGDITKARPVSSFGDEGGGGTKLYSFPAALFDSTAWRKALGLPTPSLPSAMEYIGDKQGLAKAAAEIKAGLSPTSMRGAAPMERAIREHTGRSGQAYDQTFHELDKVRLAVDQLPKAEQVEFTDRMETGKAQPNPALQDVADALRGQLDGWKNKIQGLGKGYLANAIEDYMGHIWGNYHDWAAGNASTTPQTSMQTQAIARNVARQPLRGSGNFLKQRSFPTQKEGIAAGLVPVTYNPVDLQLIKIHELQKFYHGTVLADQLKAQGLAKFVREADQRDAEFNGMVKLDDRVFQPKLYGASPIGPVDPGAYFAPEPMARIFNNYMSKGWAGQSTIYDGIRRMNNALNAMQLGFSGFHAAFVLADTTISKFALGLQQMGRVLPDLAHGEFKAAGGHAVRGIGNMAQGTAAGAPLAVVNTVMKGNALRRAWLDPAGASPEMRQVVDAFKAAGGRMEMPEFFRTANAGAFYRTLGDLKNPQSALYQARQMFRDAPTVYQKAVMAPLRIVGRLIDTMNQPLMGQLVPRAKMGVFSDLAQEWLRNNPGASRASMADAMIKIQDTVDNRLGQLNYDNLFWNKTAKDIAFITTRSVGWNLGTVREIGGSLVDAGRAITGNGGFTTRMAYTIALPIVTAQIGALMTYMSTGHGPQSMLDYFYPPTGTSTPDEDAVPERRSIPGYMKDVVAFAHDPKQTVLNKSSPILSVGKDLWQGHDFYGASIYDPQRDAGAPQAYADYLLNQIVPFGVRARDRMDKEGASQTDKAMAFWGFQPAPKSITQPSRGEAFQRREATKAFKQRAKEPGRFELFNSHPGATP